MPPEGPVSLAYWICDDGTYTGSGLRLCTHAFSINDLERLIQVLDIKLGIKAPPWGLDTPPAGGYQGY